MRCEQTPGAAQDVACQHCAKKELECRRETKWYKDKVASQWAARRAAAAGIPHRRRVSHPCHTHHAASNAAAGSSRLPTDGAAPAADPADRPPQWYHHPDYNAPGPAYKLLVGGTVYFAGLDSAGAAMFWRSEVMRTGAAAEAANRFHHFTLRMCNEALACCILPPPDERSSLKHVCLTQPSAVDKGKGRADAMEEDEVVGKGKGRATPVDKDEEPPTSSSDDDEDADYTKGERWGGYLRAGGEFGPKCR